MFIGTLTLGQVYFLLFDSTNEMNHLAQTNGAEKKFPPQLNDKYNRILAVKTLFSA
ncbi:hypothetical protein [Peribacillus sp. FSL E2-0218]|uniref:hypothetical protein n=1 Tax=Peribacillus sp. FSL E2-0218 TaxID=2921364 RepID=UPI0030EC4F8E